VPMEEMEIGNKFKAEFLVGIVEEFSNKQF
jgi:hypothetical protein